MRLVARSVFVAALAAAASLSASAQSITDAPERYSEVELSAPEGVGLMQARLVAAGVGLDHGVRGKDAAGVPVFRTVLSQSEMARAQAAGVSARVLTADLGAAVARRGGGCPASPYPVTGSMGCYPTFDEAVAILDQMRAEFPDFVSEKTSIGTTLEGRTVWQVEIGDNPGLSEGEPETLWTALHHAREPQGLATVLYSMWDLLRTAQGGDAEAQFLLAERRLFVVPVLNPDGYAYNQTTDPAGGGLWRKNRRVISGQAYGVDLNRNYGYFWGYDNTGSSPDPPDQTYRGPSAFSEPETQAIRDFMEDHEIRVALNYHTYSDLLIYPWGYEADLYTPDSAAFVDMARQMTAGNGYLAGTGNQTVGYLVNGDSDDWMYGDAPDRPRTFAFTPEVGTSFWPDPSEILPLAQENVRANRLSMLFAGGYPAVVGLDARDPSGNGFPDPGETIAVRVSVRNLGRSALGGTTARLVSTDARVTVVSTAPVAIPDLDPDDGQDIGPFAVTLAPGTPLGALAALRLDAEIGGTTVPIPLPAFTVGTPETLLADDASTLDGWSRTGTWGLSSSVFVSGPSSFSDSPAGDYPNNADQTLTRDARFDLSTTTAATLRFQTRYALEGGYDVVTVEARAGSGAWMALRGARMVNAPIASPAPSGTPVYNGEQPAWVEDAVDLSPVAGRPDVQLRFRLRSDGSFREDGFYVDDLVVERLIDGSGTVADEAGPERAFALGAPVPNPSRGRVRLSLSLAEAQTARVEVVDALGRRVAVLLDGTAPAGETAVEWNTAAAAPGVYVVRLRTASGAASRRVVVR